MTDEPEPQLDQPQAPEETEPPELDPETRARRDAALRHVRKLGDPVLRAAAVPVDRFDERLHREIATMGELMSDALGIGLAANQVGILHRVLVYRTDPEHEITALVNPIVVSRSDERESAEEGCLSLPGVHLEVERSARIRVRARDRDGEELTIDAGGLEARVIQHEIDHLDGILILDHVSRAERKEAMRSMRETQRGEREEEAEGAREATSGQDGAREATSGQDGAREATSGQDGAPETSREASLA